MFSQITTPVLCLIFAGTITQISGRIQSPNTRSHWILDDSGTFLTSTKAPDKRPPQNQDRPVQTCGDCICPQTYRPFCGSDAITYSNQCSFDCARNCNPGLRINFEGVCPVPYNRRKVHHHVKDEPYGRRPRPMATPFPMRWHSQRPTLPPTTRRPLPPPRSTHLPVQPGVNLKPDNKCVSCACAYDYAPVCASDGIVYGNMCQFECAKSTCNSYLERKAPTECWEWALEDQSTTLAPQRSRQIPQRYGK